MVCVILLLLSATLATSIPGSNSAHLGSDTPAVDDPATARNSYNNRMMRERAQLFRIQEIQDRLLRLVDGHFPSSIDPALLQKAEKVAQLFNSTGGLGTTVGRVSYLPPSCQVKHQVAEHDLSWVAKSGMYLYFNLQSLRPRPGYFLTVPSAQVRVFKYAQGEAATADEKLRVSVFNLTKPMKKNRPMRRKLLDSQMVAAHSAVFMELDVKAAVRGWLSGVRNMGLFVEVEDSDGDRKSAGLYFRSRDCSRPQVNDEESAVPASATFPILELTVVEVPINNNVADVMVNPETSISGIFNTLPSSGQSGHSVGYLDSLQPDDVNLRHQRHQALSTASPKKFMDHRSSSFRTTADESHKNHSSEDYDQEEEEKENEQEKLQTLIKT